MPPPRDGPPADGAGRHKGNPTKDEAGVWLGGLAVILMFVVGNVSAWSMARLWAAAGQWFGYAMMAAFIGALHWYALRKPRRALLTGFWGTVVGLLVVLSVLYVTCQAILAGWG